MNAKVVRYDVDDLSPSSLFLADIDKKIDQITGLPNNVVYSSTPELYTTLTNGTAILLVDLTKGSTRDPFLAYSRTYIGIDQPFMLGVVGETPLNIDGQLAFMCVAVKQYTRIATVENLELLIRLIKRLGGSSPLIKINPNASILLSLSLKTEYDNIIVNIHKADGHECSINEAITLAHALALSIM